VVLNVKGSISLKRVLLTIICLVISLTFVSCGKEKIKTVEVSSSTVLNTLFDLMSSGTEANSQNDIELEYKGKKVKEVKLVSGSGIKINFDAETLKALEDAENDETVPETNLKSSFGTLKIVYDDGTIETVGKVYLGSDKALYLKFSNNKNKDAAYKLADIKF